MSKSLRNYPDVNEVFDRDGSDAMRWFLMSSPILRGGNLVVTEEGIREGVRRCSCRCGRRTTSSRCTRARSGADGRGGVPSRRRGGRRRGRLAPEMDRYVLARTASLVDEVTALMDTFDVPDACHAVEGFLDLLTNWYVRTQRDRFWDEDEDAFDTLYTVLETLCRVAAPLAPARHGGGLAGPDRRALRAPDRLAGGADAWRDESLGAVMDQVREVVSVGARAAQGAAVSACASRFTLLEVGRPRSRRRSPGTPIIVERSSTSRLVDSASRWTQFTAAHSGRADV